MLWQCGVIGRFYSVRSVGHSSKSNGFLVLLLLIASDGNPSDLYFVFKSLNRWEYNFSNVL